MKVFGHFGDERVDFDIGEFEDSKGIDPVVEWWGEEDSFVGEILTNLWELVLWTCRNCCCHNLEFLMFVSGI